MSSDDRNENEDFNLEIESAVESFFSNYEGNVVNMDVYSEESDTASEEEKASEVDISSQEPESDTVSEEGSEPETEDSSLEPIFAMLTETENALETDDSPPEEKKAAPEEKKIGSGRREKKKFDPSATHVFNSLTEAILTVDWEVNDASVAEAREILEKIQASFPILKESRTKDIVDGMLRTLDAIAESPQRVPTSATAQLEKAIPILRGIASGGKVEEGYNELIEDAIAGLEACRVEDEPAEAEKADSSNLADGGIPFDNGNGLASKDEMPDPTAVPVEVSRALYHHSEVVRQLTPRAKRVLDLYAAAQGSEDVEELLQKICGLLALQTRGTQDIFSLNCDVAIFPTGKINNLSDFIGFQLMAMGACLRHARVLEKAFKKQPHRKKFRQSIYLMRIDMERQVEELSKVDRGDGAPSQETEFTAPAPL